MTCILRILSKIDKECGPKPKPLGDEVAIEEEERMYVVAKVGKIRTNAYLWAKYIIAYRHCFILEREIEVIERETEEYFRSSLLR